MKLLHWKKVLPSFVSAVTKTSDIPVIGTFRLSNFEKKEFTMRLPMIPLFTFNLRNTVQSYRIMES